VKVPYALPGITGRNLSVELDIRANTFVPALAPGIGAEVAFGESSILSPNPVLSEPLTISDGYTGTSVGYTPPTYGLRAATTCAMRVASPVTDVVPEPATITLLLAGAGLILRRRK
jgi:hypothetical protein